MKRLLFHGLVISLVLFGFVFMANASLLGDVVESANVKPTTSGVPYLGYWLSTLVVAGDTDLMAPITLDYTVNVEADTIIVDFLRIENFSPQIFNGLIVRDLDDDSGNPLSGVSIATNFAGWNASRLSFDSNAVYFNWQGLNFTGSTYFNATLDFGPVPIPSAVWLLGSGLIGIVGIRRRFKK